MSITSHSVLKNTRLHIAQTVGAVTKVWEVRQSDFMNMWYLFTQSPQIYTHKEIPSKLGARADSSRSFPQLYILPLDLY